MMHRGGANFFLELLLGSGTPAEFYVAALRSRPGYEADGDDLDEPDGGGYERVEVPNVSANFTSASDGTVRNEIEILFSTATASWGTIRHWALTDSPTGGVLFVSGRVTTRSVREGRTLSIPPQNMTIKAR